MWKLFNPNPNPNSPISIIFGQTTMTSFWKSIISVKTWFTLWQFSGGASWCNGHCLRRFLMIWLLRIHIFSDEGRLPLVCWDFRQPKTYLGSSHVSLCNIGGSVGQFNKNGRVNNTHNLQHFYKNSNQQIWERQSESSDLRGPWDDSMLDEGKGCLARDFLIIGRHFQLRNNLIEHLWTQRRTNSR